MDDIESSANPRWDSDYHDYANGLDVLVRRWKEPEAQ